MKLSGTALITGASSGIGKAIALSLQKEGVKIVDVSLHTEQLGYFRSVCADITEDVTKYSFIPVIFHRIFILAGIEKYILDK